MPTKWLICLALFCQNFVVPRQCPFQSWVIKAEEETATLLLSRALVHSEFHFSIGEKKFMTVKHVTRHQSSAMSIFTLMGRKPSSWSPLPQLMYLTMFSSISDAKHRLTTQSVLSWFSCKRSPWHYYKVINQCAIFLLAGLNTDVTPADNKRLPNTENQDLKYVFKKISMIVNLKGSSNGVLFNLAYFVKDIMNAFKE